MGVVEVAVLVLILVFFGSTGFCNSTLTFFFLLSPIRVYCFFPPLSFPSFIADFLFCFCVSIVSYTHIYIYIYTHTHSACTLTAKEETQRPTSSVLPTRPETDTTDPTKLLHRQWSLVRERPSRGIVQSADRSEREREEERSAGVCPIPNQGNQEDEEGGREG